MSAINTVLGPIDSADLGFTLMHEHLIVAPTGIFANYPELLCTNSMERVVDTLKKAKDGGVDTLVDATTLDLDRNVDLMAEASRRSGINIIACTGWHLSISPFFTGLSADQLAGVFVREIEQGIAGTDIKAGILKAASDMAGVKPKEEIVLRAVARAHHRTGVPIMLHSYPANHVGQQQIAVLRDEGVDMRWVKLDHSNDTTEVEYLLWLLEQGCYLGMDRYPGHIISSRDRTRTMKQLIDAGYADRLCPSHDWSFLFVTDSPVQLPPPNPHGYLYIKKVVIPELREMGVSEQILSGLCVDGPRYFFEGP